MLDVMPWNYPIWQVAGAAAPALMSGNTLLLKHASNVTGSAVLLGELARATLPEGVLQVVVLPRAAGGALIADRRVAAVTLTGSELVGVSVARACAQALRPSVLELGGSDPFIVLEDADLPQAVRIAVAARFQNTGQSCRAAKRFIVECGVAVELRRGGLSA